MESTLEIKIEEAEDRSVVFLTDNEEQIVTAGSGSTVVEAFAEAYYLLTTFEEGEK